MIIPNRSFLNTEQLGAVIFLLLFHVSSFIFLSLRDADMSATSPLNGSQEIQGLKLSLTEKKLLHT